MIIFIAVIIFVLFVVIIVGFICVCYLVCFVVVCFFIVGFFVVVVVRVGRCILVGRVGTVHCKVFFVLVRNGCFIIRCVVIYCCVSVHEVQIDRVVLLVLVVRR